MTSGSVHKHKDKKKKTKRRKKSNKSSHVEDTETNYAGSGDDITDLNEELHPIGYYINDREEMINQMFSVIKPDKLRAMLPPILKESSVDELKTYCLEELLGMSWKRISSVLEGRELDSSSESDDTISIPGNDRKSESSSPYETDKHWSSEEEKTVEPEVVSEEAYDINDRSGPTTDTDMLEIGITSEEMGELLNYVPSYTNNERKRQAEDQEEPSTSGIKKRKWKPKRKDSDIKEATKKDIEDKVDSSGKTSDNERSESVNTDESKGKTLLEILELEMRARAIRALLKQQGGASEGDDAHQSKQVSDPTVCSASASDITTKPARRKLKRNVIKPNLGSVQCAKNTESISSVLETSLSDSLPTSESRNDNKIKDTEEETGTCCSLAMNIKSEVSNEQTMPELESNDENDENRITVTKEIERSKKCSSKDREDGELSSDAEKSCDSILEIQAEGGSSDVIVLDDSEDDLLDPSPPDNQGSKDNETKEIVEINFASNQGASSNRNENKKKVSRGKESSSNDDTNPEVENGSTQNLPKTEAVDVSWAARWLQSKGVQKVVSTSKMCAKIRNRMKSAQKERKINAETPQQEEIEKQSMVIVGSVNEYNMLDKPKLSQQESGVESDEKNTDSV